MGMRWYPVTGERKLLYTAIIEDVDILVTGEKDFSDIDVERPEIMTPAEFIRKERSRYVENVPCVCFFRCQHTIKQASAKLSYVVVYPTSQVYTSRVLFSFTVRDYKKRFESSVGLQVCEYQAFDGGIFFFGNRKLRTVWHGNGESFNFADTFRIDEKTCMNAKQEIRVCFLKVRECAIYNNWRPFQVLCKR